MRWRLPLLLLSLVSDPGVKTEAATVVPDVARAIASDSATVLRAQWSRLLMLSPANRMARLRLATLERLTYQPAAARRHYEIVLGADTILIDDIAVSAAMGRSALDADALAWDVAARGLRQAALRAEALGAPVLAAEAWLDLAPLLARSAAPEASESVYAHVAALLPDTANRAWARLHCARVGPPLQPGELPESEEALAGVRRARRAGDPRVEATCLSGFAKALFRRGLIDSAVAVNARASAMQRGARDRAGLAASLQWQGYAFVASRDYGAARRALLASLSESQASGNWLPAGVALVSLSSLSVRFGELGGARRYAARADSLLRAQGNERTGATLLGIRGDIARASGDTADARTYYAEALARAQRFGGYASVAPERGLAALARSEGDWAGAERHLAAARATARQQGMKDWARRLDYDAGVLALARGDLAGAEQGFTTFLAGLSPEDRPLALPARMHLAEVAARRGQVALAESLATVALDDLDAWRAQIDDRTLRLQVLELREMDLERGIGLPVVAAAMVDSGRVAQAYALAERERARELLVAAARLRSWSAGGPDSTPNRAASVAGAPVATNARTAVLEFMIGAPDEPTLTFLVTREGPQAMPGPLAATLDAAVGRLRGLVESGADPASLDPALTTAIVGPALRALPAGIDRLVIVPDGALHRVPFDALKLPDGRLLVDQVAVVVAPSAQIALARGPRVTAGSTTRVLALANPTFANAGAGGSAESEVMRRAFADAGGLPPLPASAGEARRAASLAPGSVVRTGTAASEAWFRRAALDSFTIIHLATHAVVSDDDLGGAAIALSPGNGEDGFVTAADLAELSLHADLVVLSGCRTAGGVVVAGEGIQGLTAPLFRAGARGVLASSWRIRDADAARFMDAFYTEVARDPDVPVALRRAKLAQRAAGVSAAVWSGFLLVGDPALRVGAVPRLGRAR